MCELNPNLVNHVLFRLQYHQCWQKWKTTILNQDNDINKTLSRNKSLEPFIKKIITVFGPKNEDEEEIEITSNNHQIKISYEQKKKKKTMKCTL